MTIQFLNLNKNVNYAIVIRVRDCTLHIAYNITYFNISTTHCASVLLYWPDWPTPETQDYLGIFPAM